VIAGGKARRLAELAGEQPAGERQPHDEGHPPGPGGGEKRVDRLLPEDVEDDLKRGAALLPEAPERLVHRFDAGAKSPDLALGLQFAQPPEQLAAFEYFEWQAMELREIERVDAEPLQ
jgi:hypothetical protein